MYIKPTEYGSVASLKLNLKNITEWRSVGRSPKDNTYHQPSCVLILKEYSLYKRNLVSSQMPGIIVFKNYFVFEKYFMKEKSNVAWNFKIAQKLFLENTQMIPDGFIGKTFKRKILVITFL